ncbi:hypothetical protein [Croceimicrobium sp.]|uniref:hypothetical protein n=1 Tax=Croceimicrobium sp. TaxID=2828340 RepID=UPI003BA9049D
MELKTVLGVIQAISVAVASGVAVYGISSWRREAKWKRKYELAEEVLTCFYDISDRFKVIRHPAGYKGEGETRKRGERETQEESEVLDYAYIIIERYEKEKAPFIKLKSLKHRFMVLFGKESVEPFDEINRLVNELFYASYRLGRRHWQDQGYKKFSEEQLEKHLNEMHKYEAVFWAGYDENDEFRQSVDKAVGNMESICSKILRKR